MAGHVLQIAICYITDSQSLFVHVCCTYFVFYCFIVICLNALHSYGGNKSIYQRLYWKSLLNTNEYSQTTTKATVTISALTATTAVILLQVLELLLLHCFCCYESLNSIYLFSFRLADTAIHGDEGSNNQQQECHNNTNNHPKVIRSWRKKHTNSYT